MELYESDSGEIVLEVRADQDSVWLTRQQIATLFGRDIKTVGKHISNARREELEGLATVAKFATVQTEGTTVLRVEQSTRSALKIADRAYVLKSGRVTMQGPAAELARDSRAIEAYLGA